MFLYLAIFMLLSLFAQGQNVVAQRQAGSCTYDRSAMLSLDYDAFDQDLRNGGRGWRKLANRPGCERAAANLIRAYRETNSSHEPLLYWHEGQLRAIAGQYLQAISLFKRTKVGEQEDWNAYVDATVAFLLNDKPALVAARQRLLAVEPPADQALTADGFIEVFDNAGRRRLFRWPPNIEVVDQLLGCLGQPYRNLYTSACQ